jgi:hypothetical protein
MCNRKIISYELLLEAADWDLSELLSDNETGGLKLKDNVKKT